MAVIIYICILLLNLIAVFMVYKFLGTELEKKEKMLFIVVGIAIMYLTVSFTYWLSTKNIDLNISNDMGKNLIVFTFVPINGIITLPFMANSYKCYKNGRLKLRKYKNRIILISVILIIALVFEFFYFKDIQNGILNIIQSAK